MAAKTTICSYLSRSVKLCAFIAVVGLLLQPRTAEAQTNTTAQTTGAQTTASTAPTTTTQPPTTTTTVPPTTTIAPNEPRTEIGETAIGQCLCDLTGNRCDINCFCDPDCSDEDKNAFVPDTTSVIISDKLCYQDQVFLFTNSPARTEKTNDGLFCIYYDNNKERDYYLDPNFIQDFPTFNDYVDKYADPSRQQPDIVEDVTYTLQSIYSFGDPIHTVYQDESVGKMVIPTTLGSNQCNDQNTMAYLTEASTQCSRDVTLTSATCTSTAALNAQSYFNGFRVVKTPGLFGYVENGTFVGITTTPAPVTTTTVVTTTVGSTVSGVTTQATTTTTTTQSPTTVNTTVVQNLFDNPYTVAIDATTLPHLCRLDNGTLATCTFTNPPSPTFSVDTCSNVVLEARYTIITNGSFGIDSVLVQFVFGNVKQANFPLTQSFSLAFNSVTDSNETVARSGNPGYQFGKYLLYGELNQTSTVDGLIQTIETTTDPYLGLTVVRASASGDCSSSASDRVPLRFGQNMRTGCIIRFNASVGGDVCSALQRTIVQALEGPNTPMFDTANNRWVDNNRYVATFGNTPGFKVGDWVRIIVDKRLMPVNTDVVPTGTCQLRMGMHIQVLYANVGALANPQPKIVGVAMLYDTVRDVPTRCTGGFCQDATAGINQAFEVSQTVSFVDVSQPAVGYQGEAPVFIARVPNDFFYPFLYYTSAASRVSTEVTVSTILYSMIVTVFVKCYMYMS